MELLLSLTLVIVILCGLFALMAWAADRDIRDRK